MFLHQMCTASDFRLQLLELFDVISKHYHRFAGHLKGAIDWLLGRAKHDNILWLQIVSAIAF